MTLSHSYETQSPAHRQNDIQESESNLLQDVGISTNTPAVGFGERFTVLDLLVLSADLPPLR